MNLNCKFDGRESLLYRTKITLLNFSFLISTIRSPPILYNFYITHPFQITNHAKPITKRIRILNSPTQRFSCSSTRERKEKRKKKKHVACFRPEERETTVVVRSRPVKMAGKGEKGKGSTSVCIVHDLVLDRKQKFPAYVCDPLFLRLARGNSFPVKRRRDFEIAPCDSSLLHPATLSTPIAHHYTLLFPFFRSLSLSSPLLLQICFRSVFVLRRVWFFRASLDGG